MDREHEMAIELAKAIAEEFAEVLKRRLVLASYVYSPPAQAIAVSLATEALMETSFAMAALCVPSALWPTSAAMVAGCFRSAIDRKQIAGLSRAGELLAEIGGG